MAVSHLLVCLLLAVRTYAFVVPSEEQLAIFSEGQDKVVPIGVPLPASNKRLPKKIAIIGSGITGASAASRLYEGFRIQNPDQQPRITVFERNPVVGGRITQAYAYGDRRLPVDTCAATFAATDICIATSLTNVGLTLALQDLSRLDTGYGVWNGMEMIAVEEDFRNAQLWSEFRKAKWFPRYGEAPFKAAQDIFQFRSSFDLLLSNAIPTNNLQAVPGNANLSQQVEVARLTEYVKGFECSNVNPPGSLNSRKGREFGREVINAGARERYFANGDELNVLEFYFGYEDKQATFAREGNLRLVERLLKLSTEDVRLDTEVQKIERTGERSFEVTSVPTGGGTPNVGEFDTIILASSVSLANITFEPPLPNATDLEQRYKDSFVTHFTSPNRLNADYFNRTNDVMPQNVLTTTIDEANSTTPFFSLTLLRQLVPPKDVAQTENLYKIVSREEMGFGDIEKYLDGDAKITWINVQPLPRSVPVQPDRNATGCRKTLEGIEITPGIFYAGGGEQVVASAEFGCRMGTNAANLVLGGV